MANNEESSRFLIGLNIDGAVSAGAYTAGVMDFLIDALECWQKAKSDGIRGIPQHKVEICVMSGASAGGMTSAIAAAALTEEFHPVRSIPLAGQNTANKLHQSWVEKIDISELLSDSDLADPKAGVPSLLNSKPIGAIADAAFYLNPRAAGRRPYVAESLQLILTVTNLRGVPYSVDESRNIETQVYYYGDDRRFTVKWPAGVAPQADWKSIGEAAVATGAFPLALAARKIDRLARDYNQRRWLVYEGDPMQEQETIIAPKWDLADDDTYATLNVDGGVTNNSPFELNRRALAAIAPASPNGRNRRAGSTADRAVITIAPFPTSAVFNPKYDYNPSLLALAGKLLTVLIAQSRFSGENLCLVKDEDVFSRFMIAPKIGQPAGKVLNALSGASLGAFGGFLAREFREDDYQLGRRNCQQFLRKHFVLPKDNPLITGGLPKEPLAAQFQFTEDGQEWVPIIPLMPEVAGEIPVRRTKLYSSQIEPIVEAATKRLKRV
ncbi:MAG: hypothetical protein ACRD4P_04615, partial [Bryobacteraceae bacterium]